MMWRDVVDEDGILSISNYKQYARDFLSLDTPHWDLFWEPVKSERGDSVFFIPCGIKGKGDYVHYTSFQKGSKGYGGSLCGFKVKDSKGNTAVIKIQGPWHSNSGALFTETGIDLRKNHLTMGVVGRETRKNTFTLTDLLHTDKQPVLGAFNRIKMITRELCEIHWEELFVVHVSRGGSSCGKESPFHLEQIRMAFFDRMTRGVVDIELRGNAENKEILVKLDEDANREEVKSVLIKKAYAKVWDEKDGVVVNVSGSLNERE